MSWLDPEKMVNKLITGLGVNPQDFVAFINGARQEFAEMRADRLAFRPASIQVVADMKARMDRIENKLDMLLTRHENGGGIGKNQNGVVIHERN